MSETSEKTAVPGVTWYRKKPAVVAGVLWDGTDRDAVRAFAVAPDGAECSRWRARVLELWNCQELAWIPCPAGHVVMRGVLGEFYPVSPAALRETFGPADGAAATGPVPPGDLSNAQCAGRNGYGEVTIAFPRARMTSREALVHAAWLVLLADDDGEFPGILAAVRGGGDSA